MIVALGDVVLMRQLRISQVPGMETIPLEAEQWVDEYLARMKLQEVGYRFDMQHLEARKAEAFCRIRDFLMKNPKKGKDHGQ